MIGAVWCVTKTTIFADGRVFPKERPALICMTLKTGIVDCFANQRRGDLFAMDAVTGSAFHFALEHRMRKRFECFRFLELMTIGTDFGLRCRRKHRIFR